MGVGDDIYHILYAYQHVGRGGGVGYNGESTSCGDLSSTGFENFLERSAEETPINVRSCGLD